MDIYISDIKSDANHPRATGVGELGHAIKAAFPDEYHEREDLEQLLILMLGEIRDLKQENQVLKDRLDMISEINNLIEEPIS